MICDLENSFVLACLSGPLIITRGSRGSAPAEPPPPPPHLSGPEQAKQIFAKII